MKENKCPICKKTITEDYRIKEIVCPACNTDLSVFTLLHKSGKTNNTLRNVLTGITGLLVLVIIFIAISAKQKKDEISKRLTASEVRINQMQDSVAMLQKQIVKLQLVDNNISGKASRYFTIRKGDSFCLISLRLYGTENRSKEIADMNKKDLNCTIYPGDTILVPQK